MKAKKPEPAKPDTKKGKQRKGKEDKAEPAASSLKASGKAKCRAPEAGEKPVAQGKPAPTAKEVADALRSRKCCAYQKIKRQMIKEGYAKDSAEVALAAQKACANLL